MSSMKDDSHHTLTFWRDKADKKFEFDCAYGEEWPRPLWAASPPFSEVAVRDAEYEKLRWPLEARSYHAKVQRKDEQNE
ncbi:hypothetical protein CFAM422_006322 [Trichoderma lentiforme]|uniref:Uncharacterized protein n=1 Tax=Trichoderma lentiforme TaxID=1567552 RepID=A0A9P4XFC6_9HYPO|nr:hypothetical protein CFAM422_006322 [Trichoderma lentiforme]